MEKLLGKTEFNLSQDSGSRDSLTLNVEFFDNGDPDPCGIYCKQKLTLQTSWDNSSTFNLNGVQLTPNSLRKLADHLEQKLQECQEIKKK